MLRQIVGLLFVVVLLNLVDAGTVAIPHARLNQFLSQSSTGYYREIWGENETLRIPAGYYQDDVSKRMRVDNGVPGQSNWQSSTFYMPDKTYLVTPNNGKVSCVLIPDLTYNIVNTNYGPTFLSYVGRHTLQEFGPNQVADVFAGPAMDVDGPLGTWYYISPTNGAFLGWIRIGSIQAKLSFYEYWFGNMLSQTVPDSSLFNLPAECSQPASIQPLSAKWNPDGTPKISSS